MFQSNHQANNGNGHVTSHLQPDLHSSNLFDLGGQVAVVTGCDSSMGAMIARVMVSNGCRVYLVGCQLEQMQKMCKEFQSKDQGRCLSESKMIILQADLSSQEGCQKMKTEVEKHEKSIDILVNAEKMMGQINPQSGSDLQSIHEMCCMVSQSEAEALFRTNVIGCYFTSVALMPLLGRSRHHPQIVNVAGVSGMIRESVGGMMEAASMAAMIHMTKMMATMMANTNIRCNAIAPGMFDLSDYKNNSHDPSSMKMMKMIMDKVPAGRQGMEKEMGALMLLLTSKHQSYMSGSVIPMDGGLLSIAPGCC